MLNGTEEIVENEKTDFSYEELIGKINAYKGIVSNCLSTINNKTNKSCIDDVDNAVKMAVDGVTGNFVELKEVLRQNKEKLFKKEDGYVGDAMIAFIKIYRDAIDIFKLLGQRQVISLIGNEKSECYRKALFLILISRLKKIINNSLNDKYYDSSYQFAKIEDYKDFSSKVEEKAKINESFNDSNSDNDSFKSVQASSKTFSFINDIDNTSFPFRKVLIGGLIVLFLLLVIC